VAIVVSQSSLLAKRSAPAPHASVIPFPLARRHAV
jgi:hypothetical protein